MEWKQPKKELFQTRWWLKPICGLITNHKHRKLIGWGQSFSDGGYKYPNRHDFYYKCKICGYVFFNHKPTKEDLEFIKEFDRKCQEKN